MASFMITYTNNFTKFTHSRKFASYSGVAPFPYQSGTSIGARRKWTIWLIKERKHYWISALNQLSYMIKIRDYYLRKVESARKKMKIINAVRNKILARMFALLVKRELVWKKLSTRRLKIWKCQGRGLKKSGTPKWVSCRAGKNRESDKVDSNPDFWKGFPFASPL